VTDRRAIGRALHALLAGIVWDSPARGFAYTSERLQLWDDVPTQPAMMTQEGDERHTQTTRGMPLRILEYRVIVYQRTGVDTSLPRPADENDLIMGAIEEAIPDGSEPDLNQTLGGLVHSVRISGTVLKDDGAMDGQAMIVVPIDVIVP